MGFQALIFYQVVLILNVRPLMLVIKNLFNKTCSIFLPSRFRSNSEAENPPNSHVADCLTGQEQRPRHERNDAPAGIQKRPQTVAEEKNKGGIEESRLD